MSIVNALQDMGHIVKVLSPPGIDPVKTAGNAPVDKSDVKTSGINSIWKFLSKHTPNVIFEFVEIFYNVFAAKKLEEELSKNSYDIIYERYAFYMIAGSLKAKKYNIPFVLEANEVSGIQNRARKQSLPWLCSKFEKILFNNCTSILTVSSYLKQMIKKQGVNDDSVLIAPNAIDPNKFSGKNIDNNLINKYNLKDQTVIGFAGWFDDWDRLDLLIDVFSKLKETHKNIKILLVGDGEVLNQVRIKANEYNLADDIIMTGPVTRDVVHKYLSLLNIAVITHSNEFGSPVVMFEFMGLEIPVIAPDLLPITDVLTDNENALIFDVLDMAMLESKLSQLILDETLQKRLSSNAYDKLMTQHTWKNNAQQIIETSGVSI
ncbi:MAG: glycosyltransferase family 4 protein [Methylococcales bacterium]